VRLEDIPAKSKRSPPPAAQSIALATGASEEDLSKFSVEALKKLAKASGVELPKPPFNKSALVKLLFDAGQKMQVAKETR